VSTWRRDGVSCRASRRNTGPILSPPFWIAAFAAALAGGYLLGSDLATMLLPAVVASIFAGIYLWRESRQRAAVIGSVKARAPR
jgi:hypothetical protein